MKDWRSLAHVKWDCQYHVVIIPKHRRKMFYGKMRRRIGDILRELCRQKEVELVEGNAMPDHIHMLLRIPHKYSVAMTVGYIKGKSSIRIHRELTGAKGTLLGRKFWARGYCVSTVGLNEQQIRQYIQQQERLTCETDLLEMSHRKWVPPFG
ncbi:IS200/IS605 family transposase [Candidatus Hydrogenedentota bacterium]